MRSLLFLLLFTLLITSCQKKEAKTESAAADFGVIREAVFSKLLTPGEAAAKLQAVGADFNSTLLNDPAKWSSYTTAENKAASNLGVYLSDLNYSVAYKQKEVTKKYLNSCLELASTLGAKREVLDYLMKRYQENIDQNDSVKSYMSQFFTSSTSELKESDKERLAGITYSAYYIENLHILLGLIQTYPKDILPEDARTVILVPAFQIVLNQKDNVKLIYSYLKATANEENPNYLYYKNALEELVSTYDKLDVAEKMKNNQVKELLNDTVVKELSDKVNQIRDKVVSNS